MSRHFKRLPPHFDISTNSMQPKRKHPKVQKEIRNARFWDPPTFFRKDGDIAGDGTGGGGVPVRLEESPDRWKLAHRDWQRVRISNFRWEIYLVRECIKLICCVMYCFKIFLESQKKTKTAFWYLWVSWVWTRVLRSSTLCLSMFIYVYLCLILSGSKPKKVACPRLVLPLLRRVWPAVCVRDLLTKTFQMSNSFQTKSEDLWK